MHRIIRRKPADIPSCLITALHRNFHRFFGLMTLLIILASTNGKQATDLANAGHSQCSLAANDGMLPPVNGIKSNLKLSQAVVILDQIAAEYGIESGPRRKVQQELIKLLLSKTDESREVFGCFEKLKEYVDEIARREDVDKETRTAVLNDFVEYVEKQIKHDQRHGEL